MARNGRREAADGGDPDLLPLHDLRAERSVSGAGAWRWHRRLHPNDGALVYTFTRLSGGRVEIGRLVLPCPADAASVPWAMFRS